MGIDATGYGVVITGSTGVFHTQFTKNEMLIGTVSCSNEFLYVDFANTAFPQYHKAIWPQTIDVYYIVDFVQSHKTTVRVNAYINVALDVMNVDITDNLGSYHYEYLL